MFKIVEGKMGEGMTLTALSFVDVSQKVHPKKTFGEKYTYLDKQTFMRDLAKVRRKYGKY